MTSKPSVSRPVAVLAGILVHPAASAIGPEANLRAQLDAYNARDLRERYAARFAEPALHAP